MIFFALVAFAFSCDLKGKIVIGSKPNFLSEDFVDMRVVLESSQGTITAPKYKNNTFFISGLTDGKYSIYVMAPQLLENFETIEIVNDTIKSRKYDKNRDVLTLRVQQIDFTKEVASFDIWSLVKNPMIIMAAVSLGLLGFSKLTLSAVDEEEARVLKHPDIILANGQRVDPTKLVPKFE
ncbi:hypothetical protein EIN_318210 [Entamoeba invadens IP1]|uniref:ER membrane protein complex subunit 7 beta-sandwich domain-containing protein n=1 Tax=Entamoeba invadens IP1 TaxID=370355 RepID=A0A0A1TZH9_ENTIV|nr:hypothetical protein EIN_318210 [Entamoeba invadens IP1]ELP86992.1 hypothetical protein EIN_318210 [Entamoeba invadens IP1]|eukprot:XP_004253763.1 hypothetical protein EIN_318210 [Entamoeba invadens IP1]